MQQARVTRNDYRLIDYCRTREDTIKEVCYVIERPLLRLSLTAFHLYSNRTEERIEDDTLAVKYEDGRWSKPYYDCGGGNIWMLTYTVPFFGYENGSYHFK